MTEAHAQQGSIRGIITEAETGQPLDGARITLESDAGELRGTVTDRNGFYQIGEVAAGAYTLRVQYLGYEIHQRRIALGAGEQATASVRTTAAPVRLEDVSVTFESGGAATREMGRQRLRPIDLRRVPTPAAAGDLASYLQSLPGVVTSGDRGGQLFIRGGTHTENLTLMDGLLVYQPFHIIGFFSAFPEHLVSNVDFYAGGFPASYSGRTSSVLDVRMRDGNLNRLVGSASVSPFLAEGYAEGPLQRGRISWIGAARRSLLEETSPSFLRERQPLAFQSQFLKLTALGDLDTRCSAVALRTADRGRLDPSADDSHVQWGNVAIGGRCAALFEGGLRFLDMNVGYSSVHNSSVIRGSSELSSSVSRTAVALNTTHLVGRGRVDGGYFVWLEKTAFDLTELFGRRQEDQSRLGIGAFVDLSLSAGEAVDLQVGVSASALPQAWVEPRVRGSWRPRSSVDTELSGAIGLYRQDLTGVSDMRDASSVFVAWMPAPAGSAAQALHAQLGWQQGHAGWLRWSVEGYYRRLQEVAVPVWHGSAEFNTELGTATGTVYGADARLELTGSRLYGFVGYGYGWTRYEAAQRDFGDWFGQPVQRYHPPHDRRHQVSSLLTGDLGWFTAAARWQLGSGLPFTRPIGFDEAFDYRFQLPRVDLTRGTTRVLVDKPYQARLPVTHRLDLSLERLFPIGAVEVAVQAGAINAYDRANLFFYDIYTQRQTNQLPLVPYLSLRAGLR